MDAELYIRIRGRVLGPYDQEKLQSLARRGQLSRMHELSEDGINWVQASTYPELFVSGQVAPPTVEPQPGSAEPHQEMAVQPPVGSPQREQENVAPAPPPQAPAQPESGQKWYYEKDGAEVGPVDYALLQQMITVGQVGSNTLVWTDGMTEWVAAGQVSGLAKPPVVRPLDRSASDQSAEERSTDGDTLPLSLCRAATGSRPWVQFIAVIAFVYGGLSVLGGIFLLIEGANKSLPPVVASGLFSLIYGAVATAGGFLLTNYGNRLGSLHYSKSPTILEKALDALKGFWIYVSIFLIVLLAFVVFVVVWVVAIGGTWDVF